MSRIPCYEISVTQEWKDKYESAVQALADERGISWSDAKVEYDREFYRSTGIRGGLTIPGYWDHKE